MRSADSLGDLLTEAEAAERLRVSPDTLRRLRTATPPRIGFVLVGARSPRYRRSHLDDYLASREVVQGSSPPLARRAAAPAKALPRAAGDRRERADESAIQFFAQTAFAPRHRGRKGAVLHPRAPHVQLEDKEMHDD
jgi:hypothetical protein